jgi:hypothetical protein
MPVNLVPRVGFVALTAVAWPACAADWETTIDDNGLRRASVAGSVAYRDVVVPAKLTLQCRPGADGTVAWELEVADAAQLSGFAFGDYEGPDAPAATQRLSELKPEGGTLLYTLRSAAAGYYGATPGAFVFGIAAPANAASEVGFLAETATDTTRGYTWTVRSTRADEPALVATFGADGARRALADAMLGCGPVPPLAVDAWQGRNPASVEFWRQRAVAWRLSALLGREYPAFVERMARAQPIARDGDVVYVLAENGESPGDATVALLGPDGKSEVVFVDGGAVRRVASHEAGIAPPAAVREFIAKHAGKR